MDNTCIFTVHLDFSAKECQYLLKLSAKTHLKRDHVVLTTPICGSEFWGTSCKLALDVFWIDAAYSGGDEGSLVGSVCKHVSTVYDRALSV